MGTKLEAHKKDYTEYTMLLEAQRMRTWTFCIGFQPRKKRKIENDFCSKHLVVNNEIMIASIVRSLEKIIMLWLIAVLSRNEYTVLMGTE